MLELRGLQLTGGGQPVGGIAEIQMAANITNENGSGSGTLAIRGIRVEPLPMLRAVADALRLPGDRGRHHGLRPCMTPPPAISRCAT